MNDPEAVTIWLVQPVSPSINHQALADRIGFVQVLGALDRNLLDDPHRLVLAMGPARDDDAVIDRRLKDNKFVAGFQKEKWILTGNGYPFDQPDFALYPLESEYVRNGIAASEKDATSRAAGDHYFKHSTQLTPFPE